MDLSGKVAVVTGGGGGIGRACALGLAKAGAKVVVNDYGVNLEGTDANAGPADQVVAEIRAAGGEAVAVFETVASMAGGKRIIDAALDHFGRIDSLVTVAGIMRPANIFDMTEAEWDDVITTNLKGHFACVQPAARAMYKQQSGSVIMFTSSGGLEGSPNQPNYAATKEGILGLMRSVALSMVPYGTCNAISPSAVTRMTQRLSPNYNPGGPERLSALVNFLSSDAGKNVNGQVIAAGGDRIAVYPQPKVLRAMYRSGGWNEAEIIEQFNTALAPEPLLRGDRFGGKIHPER